MLCAEESKQHFQKMAGGEGMCCSCILKTNYTCLTCSTYYCMSVKTQGVTGRTIPTGVKHILKPFYILNIWRCDRG